MAFSPSHEESLYETLEPEVFNEQQKKSSILPKTAPRPKAKGVSAIHRPLPVPRHKSRAKSPTRSLTATTSPTMNESAPVGESKEMSLIDFVSSYSSSLPQRVCVTKGVYGTDEDSTISTHDEFHIHSVVHREVVKIWDQAHGRTFTIPINSVLKFCPVYNPNKNLGEAFRGFTLPRSSSIMARTPMPAFVCSVRSIDTGDASTSVSANEIFLVKGIEEAKAGTKRRLKVYSVTNSVHKLLDEDCSGHFTTTPTHLRMSLLQIIRSMRRPFPMAVILSANSALEAKLSKDLFTHVIMVQRKTTDVVLVATNRLEIDGEIMLGEPHELPSNLDAEVKVLHLNQQDTTHLQEESEAIKSKLQAKSLRYYRHSDISKDDYQTQVEIYEATSGSTEALASTKSKESSDKAQQPKKGDWESDYDSDSYVVPMTGNRLGTRKQLDLLNMKSRSVDEQVRNIQDKLSTQMSGTEELQALKDSIQEQLRAQSLLMQTLQSEVNQLRVDVDSLSLSRSADIKLSPQHPSFSPEQIQRNRDLLAKATTKQVLRFLNKMGMDQCKGAFESEEITGDILAECNEDILKRELGVSSRIHQIKLMKLITGRYCIDDYTCSEV